MDMKYAGSPSVSVSVGGAGGSEPARTDWEETRLECMRRQINDFATKLGVCEQHVTFVANRVLGRPEQKQQQGAESVELERAPDLDGVGDLPLLQDSLDVLAERWVRLEAAVYRLTSGL